MKPAPSILFRLKALAAAMAELGLLHIYAPGPPQHIPDGIVRFPQ